MINAILALAMSLIKNGQFVSFTYRSDMSSMRRGTKNRRNPFIGRVHKIVTVQSRNLDYAGALKRSGEERDILPIWNGKGKHIAPFVVEHTETGAKYLQISNEYLTCKESIMFVDDKPATEEQKIQIKEWVPDKEDTDIFYVKMANVLRIATSGQVAE